MRRSAFNSLLAQQSLAVATRTATANGTSVDRAVLAARGAGSALVIVNTGTITDGTHAIKLQESNDDSTWTDVASGDIQGTQPSIVAADDNKVFDFGYMGSRRHLRVVSTVTGATSGGTYGAVIVLAFPSTPPVSR